MKRTNAEVFRDGDSLHKAWLKWVGLTGSTITDHARSMAFFAHSRASTALRYDVGQVVQDPASKAYGVVKAIYRDTCDRTDPNVFDHIFLEGSMSGSWDVPNDNPGKYDPRIPRELLELAKSQLRGSCPLKEAQCQA